MPLKATLKAIDNQTATISIEPSSLIPAHLSVGDSFDITLGSTTRSEITEGRSAAQLRELLHDLIN